jgi:putative molybdopterin biosynthesis protein
MRHNGAAAGTRLRLARQARGLSQQQLAGMAGVSRQAVSAVEAGASDPSLRVALALAAALGVTVEELFGPGTQPPPVDARQLAPVAEGGRVTLAGVGGQFVALPLAGPTASRAGFLPAGGIAARGGAVRPIAPPRPTLVVAGCDPALPLLETPLGLLDPPVAFTWWPCSSATALRLAAAGLVHAAGVHSPRGSAPGQLASDGAEVIGFSAWREGLVARPGLTGGIAGLAGLRLVNREPGAQARRVLDAELARAGIGPGEVTGYHTRASGHLEVAAAIAAGLADFGVASEPAALAYGLAFTPLADERFDLVIPARQAGAQEVQAMLRVAGSRWLFDQLVSLPGYDPSCCGERLAGLAGLRPPRTPAPARAWRAKLRRTS